MGRHKTEVWIGAKEASKILTEKMGRPIAIKYIFYLAKAGRIAYRERDGRTNEYLLSDVEKTTITARNWKKKQSPAEPIVTADQQETNEHDQGARNAAGMLPHQQEE